MSELTVSDDTNPLEDIYREVAFKLDTFILRDVNSLLIASIDDLSCVLEI